MVEELGELQILVKTEGADRAVSEAQKVQDGFEDVADQANKDSKSMEKFSKKFAGVMSIVAASMASAVGILLLKVPILQEIFSGVGFLVESLAFLMDDVLRPVLEPLADAIFDLGEDLDKLPGPIKTFIAIMIIVIAVATVLTGIVIALTLAIALATVPVLIAIAAFAALIITWGLIIAAILIWKAIWDANIFGASDTVVSVVKTIRSTFEAFINWFMDTFGEELKQTWDAITGVIEARIDRWVTIITFVWDLLKIFINWITTPFRDNWFGIMDTITNVWNIISGVISGVWDVIKAVIEAGINNVLNIIQFVLAIISGDWAGAWDAMKDYVSNIYDVIVAIWEGLGAVIKGALNIAISAINTIIDALNKISIDIPDWVPVYGGKKWGFDIPSIPTLDTGGIVTSPTLATLAANRRPEAILPLDRLEGMFRRFGGGGGEMMMDVLLDARKVGNGVERRNMKFFGSQGVF